MSFEGTERSDHSSQEEGKPYPYHHRLSGNHSGLILVWFSFIISFINSFSYLFFFLGHKIIHTIVGKVQLKTQYAKAGKTGAVSIVLLK